VRDFYRSFYAPANATLVIAGDFDPKEAKALVDKYFGSLSRRDRPSPHKVSTPSITEERRVTIREPVALAQINMAWLSPPAYKEGDATADILAYVLGVGKSSRLYKRLVYDLQIAQRVSVYQESSALASVFRVKALVQPGVDIARVEEEIEKELQAIKDKPPTDKEVKRARNTLTTQMVSGLQRLGGFGGKADLLNRYNQYVGTPDYLSQDLARYEAVTPLQVQELATQMLGNQARAVVITIPEKPKS
jgi:zinc protease